MHSAEPTLAREESRILLVEDEALVRMAFAETLRAAGFVVVEAACADEAVDCLRAGAAVDLVFTDIQMPGTLDGLGLARYCRRIHPCVPLILASADVKPQKLEGATTFLAKPFSDLHAVKAIRRSLALNTDHRSDDPILHSDRRGRHAGAQSAGRVPAGVRLPRSGGSERRRSTSVA